MDPRITISIIVAMARGRVIGRDGKTPWHLSYDMNLFKNVTEGHAVIMGRKTYESLPKRYRPLLNRVNIIITHQPGYTAQGCLVTHSLEEALSHISDGEEVFIAGGGEIYQLALPLANKIYLTLVDAEINGDAFFPEFSERGWQLVFSEHHQRNARNDYNSEYRVLHRESSPLLNLGNTRHEEQRGVMEKFQARGECPFCPAALEQDSFHKERVIKQGQFWFLTHNRWPYQHTRIHLLAIYHDHAERLGDIKSEAAIELLEFFQWAEHEYDIRGGGYAMRFGDIRFNGATVNHLHAHLIEADPEDPNYHTVRFRLGPKKE